MYKKSCAYFLQFNLIIFYLVRDLDFVSKVNFCFDQLLLEKLLIMEFLVFVSNYIISSKIKKNIMYDTDTLGKYTKAVFGRKKPTNLKSSNFNN